MSNRITRRDFLKLSGLLPFSITLPRSGSWVNSIKQDAEQQNVLIIVFDAFSAYNDSLYGYQRETTPNLARLAEHAIVYHNHYAGGNFTTPGTASLLTGTHPWRHRAFRQGDQVDKSFVQKNIFTAFQNHYSVAYSHNLWAYTFLNQFRRVIDKYLPLEEYLLNTDKFIPFLFRHDSDIATLSWNRTVKRSDDGFSYLLYLSSLYENIEANRQEKLTELKEQYPLGITKNGHYPFLLEQAIDAIGNLLPNIQKPFVGYFHFFPPHDPYNTHQDFYGHFKNDGFDQVNKPIDIFHKTDNPGNDLDARRAYDEFILHVDREFGRLHDHLYNNGLLDNTWLILTSDHGEMFERGVIGHETPLLYEPLIRIPLMIFEPGRPTRTDIHTPTSAVDLLPTLLTVTNQPPANWAEGVILPPFSESYESSNRNIYIMDAKNNGMYAPLTIASTALVKENYKLIYYFGYDELSDQKERIELYDLEKDPEEMDNIFMSKLEIGTQLLHEVKLKLENANIPYL